MTAPLRYVIEAKRRGRGARWLVLTDRAQLVADRDRAWIVADRSQAEAILANSRPLLSTGVWRILEYQEAPRLALQRT